MKIKEILFIQGAGDDGYEADKLLAASLEENLGEGYRIYYPKMRADETLPAFGWITQIREAVGSTGGDLILVGHSFGASMILKCLSENPAGKAIEGIFLVAAPFWDGKEEWQKSLTLKGDFAHRLPGEAAVFFYHCRDDEEVPLSHLDQYKQRLTRATFRVIERGGHLFNNDLSLVAKDIKSL